MQVLNRIVETSNYTVDLDTDIGKVTRVSTDRYDYDSYSGVVVLPSLSDPSSTTVYNYTIRNGKVEVGGTFEGTDADFNTVAYSSMKDLDPLAKKLGDTPITADMFTLKDGVLSSTNTDLIEGLLKNFDEYAYGGSYSSIEFSGTATELTFKAIPNNEYTDTAIHTIRDIGTSKVDLMDSFVNSFKLGQNKLTATAGSKIFAKEGSFRSDGVTFRSTQEGSTPFGSVELNYNSVRFDNTLIGSDGKTLRVDSVHKATEADEAAGLSAGESYTLVIDATNQVSKEGLDEDFDTGWKWVAQYQEEILKNSYSTGDDTYHYYGLDSKNIGQALTWATMSSSSVVPESIDFVLDNGVISKAIVTYATAFAEGDSGVYSYYYQFTTTFGGLQEFVADPTPYPAGDAGVTEAFGKLAEGQTFKITETIPSSDGSDPDTIITYVSPETVLIDYSVSSTHKKYGWVKNKGGVMPYDIVAGEDSQGVSAVASDYASATDSFASHIGSFSLSSAVVDLKDGKLTVKSGVTGALENIFKCIYNKYGSNLSLDYDAATKTITALRFDYDAFFFSGQETLTFAYGADAELPAAEKTAISQMKDFVKPTSWKDGNPNVYQKMLKVFTADEIASLPFVFVSGETSGENLSAVTYQKSDGSKYDAVNVYVNKATKSDSTFVTEIEKAYKAAGFEEEDGSWEFTDSSFTKALVKGNFVVELSDNDLTGIKICKLA